MGLNYEMHPYMTDHLLEFKNHPGIMVTGHVNSSKKPEEQLYHSPCSSLSKHSSYLLFL